MSKPQQPDANIEASDFINKATANATPSNDEGRVPVLEANGELSPDFLPNQVGGTGADGALTISSGTTTIDLGGAALFVRNYTTVSITGTGVLNFSNPHASGTIIVFKCTGDFIVTSTAARAIDLRGIGAIGANIPNGVELGYTIPAARIGGSAFTSSPYYSKSLDQIGQQKSIKIACGAAGTNGSDGTGLPINQFGIGGRGGGAFQAEVRGGYNVTATLDGSGLAGTNANNATGSNEAAGGGGGGSAGMLLLFYGTLIADTGTYILEGGNGGSSGSLAGPTGTGGDGGGGGGSRDADGGNGGTTTNAPARNGENGSLGSGGGGGGGAGVGAQAARAGGTGGATLSAIVGQFA